MAEQSFDVTSVIDQSRVSLPQATVLAISLITAIFDGYDTQGIGYVAPVMARDLGFAPAALAVLLWGAFIMNLFVLTYLISWMPTLLVPAVILANVLPAILGAVAIVLFQVLHQAKPVAGVPRVSAA